MADSERDKLIESICRLKAERDQLRRKEEKWAQERERVKKGMREMVDKEIAKRADVKRKYEIRKQNFKPNLKRVFKCEKITFGLQN